MMRKRKHTIIVAGRRKLVPRREISFSLFFFFFGVSETRPRRRSLPRGFSHGDEAPEELRDKKYEIATLYETRGSCAMPRVLLENTHAPEIVWDRELRARGS